MALTAALLLAIPNIRRSAASLYGAVLIVAMLLVALYRPRRCRCFTRRASRPFSSMRRQRLTGSFAFEFSGGELSVDGFAASPFVSALRPAGIVLAIVFLVAGFWSAWRTIAVSPAAAAAWAGWGTLVPLVVLASLWIAFGNLDRDLRLRGRRARPGRDIHRRRRGALRAAKTPPLHGRPRRLLRAGSAPASPRC